MACIRKYTVNKAYSRKELLLTDLQHLSTDLRRAVGYNSSCALEGSDLIRRSTCQDVSTNIEMT